MMFILLSVSLSINPAAFFGKTMSRTVRGKLKIQAPVATSRSRSNFLTYEIFKDSLLGKYDDLSRISVQRLEGLSLDNHCLLALCRRLCRCLADCVP